mgnify:CR=1 FL=1|jgi:DNA-directed RNA polymerase subunit omega
MARVTVEDCVDKVDSRFELVLLAGNRAREISSGAPLTVDRDNDKNPVVALREIADETVAVDDLRDAVVKGLQKWVEADEFEQTPDFGGEIFQEAEELFQPSIAPAPAVPGMMSFEDVDFGSENVEDPQD